MGYLRVPDLKVGMTVKLTDKLLQAIQKLAKTGPLDKSWQRLLDHGSTPCQITSITPYLEGLIVSLDFPMAGIWIEKDGTRDGAIVFELVDVPPVVATTTTTTHLHVCPLCKSPGDDLVFKFYCSNPVCTNYHP